MYVIILAGMVLPYRLEVYCRTFFETSRGWGFRNSSESCDDLCKLSAYKMGVSMRLFKLRFLSLFKLPFSISGENRSLNEHLRAKFGLK